MRCTDDFLCLFIPYTHIRTRMHHTHTSQPDRSACVCVCMHLRRVNWKYVFYSFKLDAISITIARSIKNYCGFRLQAKESVMLLAPSMLFFTLLFFMNRWNVIQNMQIEWNFENVSRWMWSNGFVWFIEQMISPMVSIASILLWILPNWCYK